MQGGPYGGIPAPVAGFLQSRVPQRELAVDATVHGDRKLALQELVADPIILSIDDAEKMLDELLHAHSDALPQFRR